MGTEGYGAAQGCIIFTLSFAYIKLEKQILEMKAKDKKFRR